MIDSRLHSNIAIPPGEFLSEVLADLSMSQSELANRMGRPAQIITEIISGQKAITADTAIQLERVLGVPAHIWTGLEAEYRLVLALTEDAASVKNDSALSQRFPYAAMAKLKWVAQTRNMEGRVKNLRRFFGVAQLSSVRHVGSYGSAFRLAKNAKSESLALAAWLRKGELLAQEIETSQFDETVLSDSLQTIRSFTSKSPAEFIGRLSQLLRDCGVALVVLPHLPGTRVHGATFWKDDKAVILLTLRGGWSDVFWFSLFHELGHVMLHGKRSVFVEGVTSASESNEREEEADIFAQKNLIPMPKFEELTKMRFISEDLIVSFAKSVGIAPGIVVGRLQHDGHIALGQFNSFRSKYVFADK